MVTTLAEPRAVAMLLGVLSGVLDNMVLVLVSDKSNNTTLELMGATLTTTPPTPFNTPSPTPSSTPSPALSDCVSTRELAIYLEISQDR